MPAEWAGRPVLVRWQLERPMYDFKNSFSPAFVYIHREKYIFSRDMFCLPQIHGVSFFYFFRPCILVCTQLYSSFFSFRLQFSPLKIEIIYLSGKCRLLSLCLLNCFSNGKLFPGSEGGQKEMDYYF